MSIQKIFSALAVSPFLFVALPLPGQVVNDGATATLSNVTTNITGTVTVGTNGAFTRLVLSDNALLTNSGHGVISRNLAARSNEVQLISPTARWRMGGTLYVGSNGANASLIVSNGAFVEDGSASFGFRVESSNNFALVSGSGSLWSNRFALDLGGLGRGNQMIVSNGGLVISRTARLGVDASAGNNLAMVSGSGSVWSNATSLSVGNIAPGNRLVIEAGGLVSSDTGIIGDFGSASNNEAVVTGPGSLWRNNGLVIGSQIGFNRLVVSNGAAVLTGGGGSLGASSNNKLVVTGNGSIWSNATTLFLMNRADVTDGGWLACTDGYLASSNSMVVLSGPSGWKNLGDLRAGDSANGTTLLASNGGTVLSSNAFIGTGTSLGNNNLALLTGLGTLWSNRSDFIVGNFSSGNRLVLSNGAVLVTGSATLGNSNLANNNQAIVSGAGSILNNSSPNTFHNFLVGNSGHDNRLTVSDGGRVESDLSALGWDFSGSNNEAIVTGPESLWTNRSRLSIGSLGSRNRLWLTNGGVATAPLVILGDISVSLSNRIVVDGGTLRAASGAGTGSFDVRSGTNVLNAGTIDTDRLILTRPSGLFEFNGGTLITRGAIVSNNNFFVVGRAGTTPAVWDVRPGFSGHLVGELFVGDNRASNQLLISDGARFTSIECFLGHAITSSGNLVRVTGSGSLWTNAQDIYIGWTSPENQFLISAGATVDCSTAEIGLNASSNNLAVVTGIDSSWIQRGELHVGRDMGGNRLIVSGGGRVSTRAERIIGYKSGANSNLVLVADPGSRWIGSSVVYVGDQGVFNQLIVSNGAAVLDSTGIVGATDSSRNNSAIVTGAGSTWTNLEEQFVGWDSSGNQLVISNAATVFAGANRAVGERPEANSNAVIVTGPGSGWLGPDSLRVGNNGSFNRLFVNGGGRVANGLGVIGATGNSNEVIFTDPGSVWTNQLDLTIGESGAGNRLIVSNGASVATSAGFIGRATNATLNSVFITDPGTRWLIQSNLLIGDDGMGSRMIVSNGARVEDSQAELGSRRASNCTVMVTDSGSTWTNASDLLIGRSGSGNLLIISNGATVRSSRCFFAVSSGSSNNQAVVTGPGSVLANGGQISIGESGRNNRLSVVAGGAVRCSVLLVGGSSNSTNNLALISGVGSLLGVGDLILGEQGPGNQLQVANGGVLAAGHGLTMGRGPTATAGRLEIDGASVLVTNALGDATMEVRRGTNVLNAGLCEVDAFFLTNVGGFFEFNGGTFSSKQTRLSNGTLFRVGNGTSPATFILASNNLAVPGLHEFSAVLVSSNATVVGNGTIVAPVPFQFGEGSRLSPGIPRSPLGQIAFSQAPTFSGTIGMDVGREGTSLGQDQIQIAGPLTYDGALVVSNLGPAALQGGDRFVLFTAGSFDGAFSSLTLPPLLPGLSWTNKLLIDGSIEVIGGPRFTSVSLSGTNLIFNGTDGVSNAAFTLLTATNVAEPLTNWLSIATNRFGLNGEFLFTNPVSFGELQRYFRIRTP